MNVEVRVSYHYYLYKKTERHTTQMPGLYEQYHTSIFEIPCSIFDIQHRLTCGANKNIKQNLFGSGLSRVLKTFCH
jgi:hypothetical protein